ncbi:hypothetical protein NFHSH190041_20010 [Shewanella sp. NFH-SH190041]|uniref:phage terminase small subunit P27 family n=1 Tax=Shewanella sp. NFH-SH190041 TaxID=2950245 RepID=UPI0021C48B8B|nr:phage terminase small subunit P27 family [Shewanella sp. NFH-SH190041]BDM64549.1 hypothetical protein NFHSH190041_20010 [Shewanella sp. NFH-SH190041]
MSLVRAAGAGRKPDTGNSVSVVNGSECLQKVEIPLGLRDETATRVWVTQSQVLISRQLLTEADLPILLSYCNSFSLYLQAEQEVSEGGLTVSTADGGLKKHPAINARQDALSSLIRCGSLLGLDPLSRTKIFGSGNNNSEPENSFKDYV